MKHICSYKKQIHTNYHKLILTGFIFLVSSVFNLWCNGYAYASRLSPSEIYKKASPSVVLIVASNRGETGNSGTGSIISKDGLIITNAHVIANPTDSQIYDRITVYIKPKKVTGNLKKDLIYRYWADVLVISKDLDIALIKLKGISQPLPAIKLGNADQVNIGDKVVAIGHPEQGGLWTLTTGVISGQLEDFKGIKGKNVFQTETSLNKGNSGGPLLDSNGFMVGINTSIARKDKEGLAITDINFALKSNIVKKWLDNNNYIFAYANREKPSSPSSEIVKQRDVTRHEASPSKQSSKAAKAVKTEKSNLQKRTVKMESVIEFAYRDLEKMMVDIQSDINNLKRGEN